MKKVYVLFCLMIAGFATNVDAQIAAWDFTGATSVPTWTATTFNANLVATAGANNITRGAGAAASAGANSFRTVGFTNDGIATTNTDYFQITLTANASYTVSLSTIDARFAGTGTFAATPGVSSQFAYSLDGTNFTLIGSPSITIGTPATLPQIDLTGVTALQNVAAGITITLRYYASGQTTTGGWGFNSPASGINGLAIDGTVLLAGGGTPDIVLSSPNPAVAAGNILQGSTNNPIYRFDLGVTTADAVLNGVTINTAGTYTATDISNFKCWYSADNIFNSGSDVLLSTLTPVTTAGAQVFPSFTNQLITDGSTGYIFITADVDCAALLANDISVAAITTADISFLSANKSGTAFAGGLQTIDAAVPNDVTAPAASVANASSNLSWTNPAGCYDEVLIVAATATNTGTPTGDGTAYTDNLNYGTGTALGNGFVVYKGTLSGQTVTGLTNGTPYFYKFFTRFGTTWSAGVEVSATPAVVTLATDYFRSVASGSWATLATWESSSDSAVWIPATLVPGALAAHVVVQSPDSVWLTANRTTANLTIMSGAAFNATTFTMTAVLRFNLLGTASYYQGGTVQSVPGTGVEQVLDVTSNYHFNGTQAGTASIAYPAFGNLIWEPAASGSNTFQSSSTIAPANLGLYVAGDMTINIQGGTPREVRFVTGSTTARSHVILGNLNIIGSNSIAVVTNGTTALPVLPTPTLTVIGDLNVSNGGILQGTSSSAGTNGSAVLALSGDINNNGGIIQTGNSTAGLFTIAYVGTGAQSINSAAGTFTFTANQLDTINKPSGDLTLVTPITHAGTIRFIKGIVNTDPANLLTMDAGSSVSDANNASFVNGPVAKIGNTDFTFPVGKINSGPASDKNGYAPIIISNSVGGAATDQYSAEYFRASASALGPITAVGLDHVSHCDYWILDQDAGTSTLDVTLTWQDSINNCSSVTPYVNNVGALVVAHHDGADWDAFGGVGTGTGNTASGTITWPGVSVFSPFAIGSVDFTNPLPITINYFTGAKQNGDHLLNWKVTCVSSPSANIELERSTDGRNFSSIYSLFATAVRCQQPFDYTDNVPAKGVNYYRIKMTDATGKVTYSSIVSLINGIKGIDVMNIAPNPIVNGSFNVKISSAEKTQMELVITDMQGRVLQKQAVSMIAGFNTIPMNVRKLAAGTYQLFGQSDDGRTRVLRFVIQ